VDYTHDSGFWLEAYVISAMAVNSPNTVYAPAYELVGVRAGYNLKPLHCQLFFGARNLTNATWVSAVAPDAGNGAYSIPATAAHSMGTPVSVSNGGDERT
jgi:outer membrane receptor protein involved in Fe transport